MTFDNLLIERDGPVASVTISRPRVLNASEASAYEATLLVLPSPRLTCAKEHAPFSKSESRPSQVGSQHTA